MNRFSNYKPQSYKVAPTSKQIAFVDEIAKVLCIKFPTSSHDFNKRAYSDFITRNIEDFYVMKNYYINTNNEATYLDYCKGFTTAI